MQQLAYLDEEVSMASLQAAVYQRHAPGILAYLRLHMRSCEDAEDLLVDIFLASFESATFQRLEETQRRQWLWRVARNKLIDYYRASARRQMLNVDDVADEIYYDEEFSPENMAERGEEFLRLRNHVCRLSPFQQQILRLRFVYGMRCSEIAAQVGKSEGAVRTQLSRTLNKLHSIYMQA